MPVKQLPPDAQIDNLKQHAKDLLTAIRAEDIPAFQRAREFHPRMERFSDSQIRSSVFTLGDAQLTIGREYGFASWEDLRATVAESMGVELQLSHHERIEDPTFRQAVDLIDEGNITGLNRLVEEHPQLLTQSVTFAGDNYFSNPTLLEFIAENPIRNNDLPDNIVDVTRALLQLGADRNRDSVDMTLSLVCSGNVVCEQGVQTELIDVLCDVGAEPGGAMMPALSHGEFDAAEKLIERGATLDIVSAAAMGHKDVVQQNLPSASDEHKHQALAMAAQHGRTEVLKLLLESGEDPNRFNPDGFHAHSTPLHQAALAGHMLAVKELIKFGAKSNLKDTIFDGTALGWAKHTGHVEIAEFIEKNGADS